MVYVISKDGQPLMPTKRNGKVYRLLKTKQAKVFCTKKSIDLIVTQEICTFAFNKSVSLCRNRQFQTKYVKDTDCGSFSLDCLSVLHTSVWRYFT